MGIRFSSRWARSARATAWMLGALSCNAASADVNVPCQLGAGDAARPSSDDLLSGGYVVDGWNVVSRSCIVAGAQESLTYKYGDHRWLWTASAHYDMWGKWLHNVNTVEQSPATNGWQDRWCSYAGHFGSEFWFGRVHGYHWVKLNGGDWLLAETFTTSCDIGLPTYSILQ